MSKRVTVIVDSNEFILLKAIVEEMKCITYDTKREFVLSMSLPDRLRIREIYRYFGELAQLEGL